MTHLLPPGNSLYDAESVNLLKHNVWNRKENSRIRKDEQKFEFMKTPSRALDMKREFPVPASESVRFSITSTSSVDTYTLLCCGECRMFLGIDGYTGAKVDAC